MRNVKYAKCVRCGKIYEAVPDLTNCSCGGILDIVYDYDYINTKLTKDVLAKRENRSMWRYRELLPVEETTPDTPLRVGWSPLYEEPKLADMLGLRHLWIKDDGQNQTASLKDRASAMAVAKAEEAGAKIIACSSTGNAASSLAGFAMDNMTRDDGWRFLIIGRRIERLIFLCEAIAQFLRLESTRASGSIEWLLELADSIITYRSRYMAQPELLPALIGFAHDDDPVLARQARRALSVIWGPDPDDLIRGEIERNLDGRAGRTHVFTAEQLRELDRRRIAAERRSLKQERRVEEVLGGEVAHDQTALSNLLELAGDAGLTQETHSRRGGGCGRPPPRLRCRARRRPGAP